MPHEDTEPQGRVALHIPVHGGPDPKKGDQQLPHLDAVPQQTRPVESCGHTGAIAESTFARNFGKKTRDKHKGAKGFGRHKKLSLPVMDRGVRKTPSGERAPQITRNKVLKDNTPAALNTGGFHVPANGPPGTTASQGFQPPRTKVDTGRYTQTRAPETRDFEPHTARVLHTGIDGADDVATYKARKGARHALPAKGFLSDQPYVDRLPVVDLGKRPEPVGTYAFIGEPARDQTAHVTSATAPAHKPRVPGVVRANDRTIADFQGPPRDLLLSSVGVGEGAEHITRVPRWKRQRTERPLRGIEQVPLESVDRQLNTPAPSDGIIRDPLTSVVSTPARTHTVPPRYKRAQVPKVVDKHIPLRASTDYAPRELERFPKGGHVDRTFRGTTAQTRQVNTGRQPLPNGIDLDTEYAPNPDVDWAYPQPMTHMPNQTSRRPRTSSRRGNVWPRTSRPNDLYP